MRLRVCCGLVALVSAWAVNAPGASASGPGEVIPFDSDAWEREDARVETHAQRQALAGTAYLKDVEFSDGVIEVDLSVTGARSYPGIVFRRQGAGDYERLYLRPHRAGLYPDAVQYTPSFHGVSGWQLYHGQGCTAGAQFPRGEWFRLRIEVQGAQARVYLGDDSAPALEISELRHGVSKGTLGLMGPKDGSAWFSNFRWWPDDTLQFGEPPAAETPEGIISDWELSRAFPAARMNAEEYPRFYAVFYGQWQEVTSEPTGLVDIARHVAPGGAGADCVMARRRFRADAAGTMRLSFGYSDQVTVFMNGQPVFVGHSGYQSRDRSFLGIVGLHDAVHVPVEKGLNEIMLLVSETFGGWGFMARADRELAEPARDHSRLRKVWETDAVFKIPESVLYDAQRGVMYVSSFNKVRQTPPNSGFISRLGLDGQVQELEWVTGLDGPCGMGIVRNRLYAVEGMAGNLVEIDIDSGEVLQRVSLEGFQFLNDVAVDEAGRVYVSNTSRVRSDIDVYVYEAGDYEVWKTGDELHRSNGLYICGGKLIVGSVGDGHLKAVGLDDRRVDTITSLGAGVIDGIRTDRDGNYLVSHWEGQVYVVSPEGTVVEVLDTMTAGMNAADFEFICDQNLLVVPTFMGNKVVAYEWRSGTTMTLNWRN